MVHSQLTKNCLKLYICKRCFAHYNNKQKLEEHKPNCYSNSPAKIVLPTEEDKILKFNKIGHTFRVPYAIYADFESILLNIEGWDPNPADSYSNKFQKHEAYSFCYIMVTPEGFEKPVLYRGENAAKIFISRMKEEAEKIAVRYRNIVPMTLLTAAQQESFRTVVDCHICSKPLGNDRARDHCHLMGGGFRVVTHSECNLQYKMPIFLPIFIHNLSGYDSHFMITELGYDNTIRFMASSLASLVGNLPSDKFKCTKKIFGDLSTLIQRKGVYPYDYTDSWEKLNETCLPPKEDFFNRLTDSDISDEDYTHAKTVWNTFQCKTLIDYSDVYLKSDVTLLADVFENFRDVCFNAYKLDPAWYYTAPGLTFDAMLKHAEIELELLTDYDMILMIEKGIRGGISQCCKRYVEAKNKYMKEYDSKSESCFLSYLDANNLYGWALSRPLPYANFRWLSLDEIRDFSVDEIPEYNEKGYILEVDLEYPTSLHDKHSDLPLCPENKAPPGKMHKKLLTTLEDKMKYTIHYVNLKQALSLGLRLKKVHRVIEFSQSPWLKSYIDLNTDRRKVASNDFEKDFYKLMNNAVFGKTMENVRKRINLELVTMGKRLDKLISMSTFLDRTIFNENLVAIHRRKSSIKMDKPIYIGFCVLDLTKGITKTVIHKALHFSDYEKCLLNSSNLYREIYQIRSLKHKIQTVAVNKLSLSSDDDKRYILEDGINTLAWGHNRIS
ncbi:hypothetical protein J437_LFUL016615 [Ladona fulva]|uniref:DNA-directed DNA polymerase n=1 Tax=Ladona fulva TaxID=123851 RepID=A0A8K0P9C0_LADFU|nr:hypothetical protein J437_LFUL016615 [Ladona fulva]